MKRIFFTTLILIISWSTFGQWIDYGNRINTFDDVGIGGAAGAGSGDTGLKISYVDGGSGTVTFKNYRYGGNWFLKRNSANGERNQFYFGGSVGHRMDIYGSNNDVKVRVTSDGDSYLNGGNVGIGTDQPDAKLAVNGTIHTKEVKVDLNGWSDFVFENDYHLRTLEEVEQHINDKGHLPEIPSESEIIEKGLNLGEMDAKLLQKIEELTLYLIEQNNQNQAQQARIEELEQKLSQLENE